MKLFKYSTFLILIAFLSSCTDWYEEDLSNVIKRKDVQKTIAIEGTITSEYKKHTIVVSRTIDYDELYLSSDSDSKKIRDILMNKSVSGAKVYVEVAGVKYEFREMKRTNYLYYTDYNQPIPTIIDIPYDEIYYESIDSFAGIPNQEHKLVVEVEEKTYTATDVMPQVSEITFNEKSSLCREVHDYREFPESSIEFDTSTVYPTYLFGQQEASIIDFHSISNYNKEDEANGKYYYTYYFTDPCYSFRQLASPQLMGALSEVSYRELVQGSETINHTDVVVVLKKSCSPSYEYFLYCLFQNKEGTSFDFGDISSNLPTNITNGGVGFFAACDVKRKIFNKKELVQLAKSIGNIIEF